MNISHQQTHKVIIPPTGDGIPCSCTSGPRDRSGNPVQHTHGEFKHLLPRLRHRHREPGFVIAGRNTEADGG